MARNPTQLIIESLARDPGALRTVRRRLTLRDEPAGMRDRIENAICRTGRGYVAIRNERAVRTDIRLGPLRRELVQWASQHAPADIGGFHALLIWALRQVDWPTVIHTIDAAVRLPDIALAVSPRRRSGLSPQGILIG